jgi:DNA-binding NarL/FixJ family response regulator
MVPSTTSRRSHRPGCHCWQPWPSGWGSSRPPTSCSIWGAGQAAQKPPAPSPVASLGLTRREVEVLALVAAGRTNRQIGQALFITPKTASLHVSRILAKLRVAGRGEAAAVAHRLGLDKP